MRLQIGMAGRSFAAAMGGWAREKSVSWKGVATLAPLTMEVARALLQVRVQ